MKPSEFLITPLWVTIFQTMPSPREYCLDISQHVFHQSEQRTTFRCSLWLGQHYSNLTPSELLGGN